MPTHNLIIGWSRGGENISKTVPITADGEICIEISVPNSSTDLHVLFNAPIAQMKSVFISSDKALTIETNDGTSPDDTINLVADKPVVWYAGGPIANPFSADLTGLYLTNSSGATATLEVKMTLDATP